MKRPTPTQLFLAADAADDASMAPLLEINTTPLIDVMLVLLVMLIVTMPIQLQAINLAHHQPVDAPAPPNSHSVRLQIDAQGQLVWQGQALRAQGLDARMAQLAAQPAQAELRLEPQAQTPYAVFAQVLAAAQRHGLQRVTVLTPGTEP